MVRAMRTRLLPMGVTICSIALFVMCLFGNAYYIAYPTAWVASWRLLGCGWYGAFLGVFAWYANPALVMAWIFQFKGKGKLSLLAAIIALALIVAFFFSTTLVVRRGPAYSYAASFGIGFWLWLAAAATQVLGSLIRLLQLTNVRLQGSAA